MAKCSREQRDRAVDLYVRYERCAADVIHELGYPAGGCCRCGTGNASRRNAPEDSPLAGNGTGGTRTSRNGPRWTITSDTAGV